MNAYGAIAERRAKGIKKKKRRRWEEEAKHSI